MENQQEFLTFFQDQLAQWYQLAQEQPLYAAAIAVSVWLLMAIFYSIRIGFLKKDLSKLTKSNSEIQASLDTAQKHTQALQDQVADLNKQLQQAAEATKAEARRANQADQHLAASNKQLAESLAKLVECFELSVEKLPAADAENLLTEYQSVVERVSERFQTEQQSKTQLQLSFHAESAKLAEKEMLISSLQHRLDSQTQQLAQMELAIEQYEAAQRQLEADREEQLARVMAKQQADAAKVAELEKAQAEKSKATEAPYVEQNSKSATPPPAMQPETLAAFVKPAPAVSEVKPEPAKTDPKEVAKPVAETSSPVTDSPKKAKAVDGGKLKGFFGKAMDKIAKMDEKLGTQTAANVEPEPVVEEKEIIELEPVQAPEPETKPVAEKRESKPSEGMGTKMSGLFGGFKKAPAKQAVEELPEQQPEVAVVAEPENAPTAVGADKEAAKSGKKLAGLFGKFKK